MSEIQKQVISNLTNYLISRQIQIINNLWEEIVFSRNDKSEQILNSLKMHLEKTSINNHHDKRLIEYMKNNDHNSWQDILFENNISDGLVAPNDWINIFKPKNDISTQADDIKSEKIEISTQTSSILTGISKPKNKNNSTQTANVQSYAAVLKQKSNENKDNKINAKGNKNKILNKKPKNENNIHEIYSVETNNRFDKLSSRNKNHHSSTRNFIDTHNRNAATPKLFTKDTPKPSSTCNNPKPKDNFHRNQPPSVRQREPTFNYIPRKPKEIQSPSLLRRKWQGNPRNFRDYPINNFNLYNQNQNYSNNNQKFLSNNRNISTRNFSKNNYFKNDTFGNNLPLILTNLFMQWINSNLNSNQINNKKNTFYNYQNINNRNHKPYGKIII